jgi:hypothetical protein
MRSYLWLTWIDHLCVSAQSLIVVNIITIFHCHFSFLVLLTYSCFASARKGAPFLLVSIQDEDASMQPRGHALAQVYFIWLHRDACFYPALRRQGLCFHVLQSSKTWQITISCFLWVPLIIHCVRYFIFSKKITKRAVLLCCIPSFTPPLAWF